MKSLLCTIIGHCWEGGLPSGHEWCRRCERYDDDQRVVRVERVVRFVRRWTPVWIGLPVRRYGRDLSLRVGLPAQFRVYANLRLHLAWDVHGELPGVSFVLLIGRIELYVGVGHGWQNEDGGRSFFYVGLTVDTTGHRHLACTLFGHKPRAASLMSGYVYCERCDETLERVDVKAAA